MTPRPFGRTDWSILSELLRAAQQSGWQVEFRHGGVQVWNRRAQPGVIVLPARLVQHARSHAWRCERLEDGMVLRHPAVRQMVTLRLA